MRRSVDRIAVLIFAALLFAPLLQMITHLVHEPLVEERREPRSVHAALARLLAMDPGLSDDINGWFDDRHGFRSVLIRLKNEIDYQLFASSDKVVIGKQGWLFEKEFLNDVVEDADNRSLDAQILSALRNLRDCLSERGVKLVFVLNATKSSIYPQFLPTKLPVDPPMRLSRRLAEVLRHEPGIAFIDGEQILLEHNDEELFWKNDVHMNLKAASYVYREMISQIAQLTGQREPTLAPESWNAVRWNGGSEARFLAKLFPLANAGYVSQNTITAWESDQYGEFEWKVGSAEIPKYPELPLFDVIFRNKRDKSALLPPIMLFGTSFVDLMFDLKYNDVFSAIYRTRSNTPERIGPLMRHLPDDVRVFVIEFPEMLLSRMSKLDFVCNS